MGIVNRGFTYGGMINVNSKDLALAKAGKKTCTIRLGKLGVAREFVYLSDRRNRLKVRVLKVDNSRVYSELTDQDAIMDGLESKQKLDEDLKKFYGLIDQKQPMTVIYFQVLEGK